MTLESAPDAVAKWLMKLSNGRVPDADTPNV